MRRLPPREYMFPFVTVVECPEARMLEAIGPTLVCSAITEKPELRRALLDATHVDRLNLGPIPTIRLNWLQPHEGNIVDFSVPPARVAERRNVKILFVTAGAAGMYCGSCLRDNALAAELKSRGHDVLLVPLYTPTLTDEPNVSEERVALWRHQRLSAAAIRGVSQAAAAARSAAGFALAHQGGGVRIDLHRSAVAWRADHLDAQRRRRLSAQGVREAARVAGDGSAARRHPAAERPSRQPCQTASP